jgi:hypothetical protein
VNNPYSGLVPNLPPKQKETQMPAPIKKTLVASKTFWVNAITGIAGIVTAIGGSDMIQENPKLAGVAAMIISIVNVLLRLVTKDPVKVV